MKHLRTKFIILFIVIALLPAIPLAVLVQGLMQRSVSVGVNPRVSDVLQTSFDLLRDNIARHRSELRKVALVLAKTELPADSIRNFITRENLDLVEYFNSRGVPISKICRSDSFTVATGGSLVSQTMRNNAGFIENDWQRGKIFRAVEPVVAANGDTGFVVVSRFLAPTFINNVTAARDVLQMYRSLDFVRSDLQRAFLFTFFIVYIPFLLIAVALAVIVSRKITAPIERLATATEKVAAGDWYQSVASTSQDEVGRFIRSFNQMVKQLKANQEQLISLEKMAAWREIARVLAHEIKNPLTPIQLTVQQLKDKYSDNNPGYKQLLDECTEIINDEIENLRTLVREFSSFARMPELKREHGQLNELIQEVARLYQSHKIILALDDRLPVYDFDHEKMRRVLINLVDNAVAASPPNMPIQIETRMTGAHIVVQVLDHGIGILEENLLKIFEPYFSTKRHGIGLGLAVVKKVIEEHGGQVLAANRPDTGARVSIQLPIKESKQNTKS